MDNPANQLPITPETKIGILLDTYPELEEVLIELAPPFAKLRNPILRKTVAKVTSLKQAARVGNVELGVLINRLREAVGISSDEAVIQKNHATITEQPAWCKIEQVVESLDVRPQIEAGEQPLGIVMKQLKKLKAGQVLEVITPFEPAPLIDTAKEKGFSIWSTKVKKNVVKTYFCQVK